MEPTKLLKDLRDGLWQASIERQASIRSGGPSGDQPGETYELPLDEVAENLRADGFLTDAETLTVVDFLSRFDPGDGVPEESEVLDPLATEITRITAELRSARENRDRDLGGFGTR